MQVTKLVLAVAEFQRQVDQEHRELLELELDDQALDAGVEIVKALAVYARRGEKRIALLAHDRHQLVDGRGAVFALIGRVVTQRARHEFRLVHHTGANRPGIDLEETDDVRIAAI